jgi:hypothetical protein
MNEGDERKPPYAEPGAGVHSRVFGDEVMLLDLESGQYFSLNAVGTRMWARLAEGKSPAEVANDLQSEYDIEPQVLLKDCVALADELLRRGLLRRRRE